MGGQISNDQVQQILALLRSSGAPGNNSTANIINNSANAERGTATTTESGLSATPAVTAAAPATSAPADASAAPAAAPLPIPTFDDPVKAGRDYQGYLQQHNGLAEQFRQQYGRYPTQSVMTFDQWSKANKPTASSAGFTAPAAVQGGGVPGNHLPGGGETATPPTDPNNPGFVMNAPPLPPSSQDEDGLPMATQPGTAVAHFPQGGVSTTPPQVSTSGQIPQEYIDLAQMYGATYDPNASGTKFSRGNMNEDVFRSLMTGMNAGLHEGGKNTFWNGQWVTSDLSSNNANLNPNYALSQWRNGRSNQGLTWNPATLSFTGGKSPSGTLDLVSPTTGGLGGGNSFTGSSTNLNTATSAVTPGAAQISQSKLMAHQGETSDKTMSRAQQMTKQDQDYNAYLAEEKARKEREQQAMAQKEQQQRAAGTWTAPRVNSWARAKDD